MIRAIILSHTFFAVASGLYQPLLALEKVDLPLVDDRPALPFPPGVSLESVCGLVDDLQHVELYDGSLGVTNTYVDQHEHSVVQFQWKSREEIVSQLGDLPERSTTEPAVGGAADGQVADISQMLTEYYSRRGWDRQGVPRDETLARLEL